MEAIAHEYIVLNNEDNGIVSAKVVSSVELAKEYEAQIVSYIKKHSGAKEVKLEKVVDEDIIGGVIIRFGDYLLDNSISTQINNLKKELNIA
jgi:F-type H+-transporting ATPase subunit delta